MRKHILPVFFLLLILAVSLTGCQSSRNNKKNDDPSFLTGLIAYYPLDGNADIKYGIGNSGTIVGADSTQNRFQEDGKALYVVTPNYIYITDTPNKGKFFTIAFWVKASSISTDFIEWGSLKVTQDFNRFKMRIVTTPNSAETDEFQYDVWNHFAATYDGTRIKVYLNGKLGPVISSYTGDLNLYNEEIFIGGWNGSLDELYIYERVLSDSEICQLAHQKQ